MIAGSTQELSADDRIILDLESDSPTPLTRRTLCDRLELTNERYETVLDGLADTDAAYSYAPRLVRTIREARNERFKFYRRSGRSRTWSNVFDKGVPE
ncbi:DUF3263 domain-containing protein [Brevibacterium aurantiacum]|uniref:DUF3263 domain-containing protein n=1 Tax=Brevibacterium aurantiacum TaxID=273384 RepID=UPI000C791439|nr:DUF3263 domain-containing protein [Brevibacterium aurantiacum]